MGTGLATGAILAGGRAVRLGGIAKGLLDVGGQRIIDRVAAALAPLVRDTFVVANAPDADQWLSGARVVRDVLHDGGGAAGIHAALMAANGPVLAVAWDLPFVTTPVLRLLLDRAASAHADAVVPGGPGAGDLEPLCGWYAPACAAAIAAAWPDGDKSLHGLLRRVHAIVVPLSEISAIADPARAFLNVNTPQDLERARTFERREDGKTK